MQSKLDNLGNHLSTAFLAAGFTLLLFVAAALIHRWISSYLAIPQFEQSQVVRKGMDIDLSASIPKNSPVALLRLDRLKIQVPVFEGTDALALNRGAGWIAGTAKPGEEGDGNVGIAGHRDGVFRGFKNVVIGDELQLSARGVVNTYAVDSIEIVNPDKVAVLLPRGVPSLTIVTCYPFYFIGNAPKRFVVHAKLQQQIEAKNSDNHGSPALRTVQIQHY